MKYFHPNREIGSALRIILELLSDYHHFIRTINIVGSTMHRDDQGSLERNAAGELVSPTVSKPSVLRFRVKFSTSGSLASPSVAPDAMEVTVPIKSTLAAATVRNLVDEFVLRVGRRFPQLVQDFAVGAIEVPVQGQLSSSVSGENHEVVRLDVTMNEGDTLDCYFDYSPNSVYDTSVIFQPSWSAPPPFLPPLAPQPPPAAPADSPAVRAPNATRWRTSKTTSPVRATSSEAAPSAGLEPRRPSDSGARFRRLSTPSSAVSPTTTDALHDSARRQRESSPSDSAVENEEFFVMQISLLIETEAEDRETTMLQEEMNFQQLKKISSPGDNHHHHSSLPPPVPLKQPQQIHDGGGVKAAGQVHFVAEPRPSPPPPPAVPDRDHHPAPRPSPKIQYDTVIRSLAPPPTIAPAPAGSALAAVQNILDANAMFAVLPTSRAALEVIKKQKSSSDKEVTGLSASSSSTLPPRNNNSLHEQQQQQQQQQYSSSTGVGACDKDSSSSDEDVLLLKLDQIQSDCASVRYTVLTEERKAFRLILTERLATTLDRGTAPTKQRLSLPPVPLNPAILHRNSGESTPGKKAPARMTSPPQPQVSYHRPANQIQVHRLSEMTSTSQRAVGAQAVSQ